MTYFLQSLIYAFWLNIVFLLIFVLPSLPLVSWIFPGSHRSVRILLSIVFSVIGGVGSGIVLFATGTYSVISLSIILAFYYILSYAAYYALSGNRLDIKSVIREYRSILSAFKLPFKNIWYSAAFTAILVGAILRYHSALTTHTMGSGDAWGHLYMASNLLYRGQFFASDFYGAYPRGIHIIYCELSSTTGLGLLNVLRFGGPMIGTFTMLAAYVLAKEFFNQKTAAIAVLLYIIPVLGLLPPPFPVWFGYLFPRQTIAITENMGLIFMVAQIVLAHRILCQYRSWEVVFFFIVAVAFAYIHPISVLYTAILLIILGAFYIDVLLKDLTLAAKYVGLVLLSPITVYLYYTSVKYIYGISPSGAQSDANIVSEASSTLFGLPYYNINPYYTFLVIILSVFLGYAVIARNRKLAFFSLAVMTLTILSCLGIGLFTSPARPVYYLNFYTVSIYAFLIYILIHPIRLLSVIAQVSQVAGSFLYRAIDSHSAFLLYPASIISIMSIYSALLYLRSSSFSPLQGEFSVATISMLSFIAAPIFIFILDSKYRLFYGVIVIEGLSLVLIQLTYLMVGLYTILMCALASLALVAYMHAVLPGMQRRVLLYMEALLVLLAILYILPSASVVRKLFPLSALLTVILTSSNIRKLSIPVAGTATSATIVYFAIRSTHFLYTMPWYYLSLTVTATALFVLAAARTLHTRDVLIVGISSFLVPLSFSMYYISMFALSVPLALLLLAYALHTPRNDGRSTATAVDTRMYSLLVSLYLFTELTLLYPPVMAFMSSMGMRHFITRVSWILPEFVVISAFLLRARIYRLCDHSCHPEKGLKSKRPVLREHYSGIALRTAALALIFIMVIPPFVPIREVPAYQYEEWVDNIARINTDFKANETVVYGRIDPGFLMQSAFSQGMDVRSLDQLLSVPPMYYTTTKKNTLICVDKYNYSRYSALPTRYFHSDYWRTPEVYEWIETYKEFHGNNSVSVYIEGEHTRVYLIECSRTKGTQSTEGSSYVR